MPACVEQACEPEGLNSRPCALTRADKPDATDANMHRNALKPTSSITQTASANRHPKNS
jgi:hypothetical protein